MRWVTSSQWRYHWFKPVVKVTGVYAKYTKYFFVYVPLNFSRFNPETLIIGATNKAPLAYQIVKIKI